jgi:hypothetical protein
MQVPGICGMKLCTFAICKITTIIVQTLYWLLGCIWIFTLIRQSYILHTVHMNEIRKNLKTLSQQLWALDQGDGLGRKCKLYSGVAAGSCCGGGVVVEGVKGCGGSGGGDGSHDDRDGSIVGVMGPRQEWQRHAGAGRWGRGESLFLSSHPLATPPSSIVRKPAALWSVWTTSHRSREMGRRGGRKGAGQVVQCEKSAGPRPACSTCLLQYLIHRGGVALWTHLLKRRSIRSISHAILVRF